MQQTHDGKPIVTVLDSGWLADFLELAQKLQENRKVTDLNILAAGEIAPDLLKRLRDLRAYIRLLTEIETADEKLAIKVAFLVRRRFLLAVARETEMRFPVGITRFLLEIRQKIRCRFTVLQDIPRAWLFQRCLEVLTELQFKVSENIESAEEIAIEEEKKRPENQLTEMGITFEGSSKPKSVGNQIKCVPLKVQQLPHCKLRKADPSKKPDWRLGLDGPCLQKCRPVALNELKLSRMEAAAALDIPETSFRRLLAKCKPEKKG